MSLEKVQYIGKGESFEFNKDLSITAFIEKKSQEIPAAIAVKFEKNHLTYQELNENANQLANYLLSSGKLGEKSKIAVYLKPGLNIVITILAILKTGSSYIPLDTSYPIDRLNFMLKDSDSSFLITDSSIGKLLNFDGISVFLDKEDNAIKKNSNKIISSGDGNSIAYIIYTSGSTGVPKGVIISHLSVNNHMLWMKNQYKFNKEDKILLKTPVSFDPSVWELFLPLYVGCELIIAPSGSHLDLELLINLIIENNITTIQLVPSMLEEILKHKRIRNCQSLKRVFVGGESLRTEIKESFFDNLSCKLINLYGPTEATIDITSHVVTSSPFNINNDIIGSPIFNTSLYVLNSNLSLCCIGEEGELYISSDSLAQGYYNRTTSTQENFLKNPFEPARFPTMYKTGDMVRWLDKNILEYLGRNNDQIKINGVRIEPKELILTILKNKEISDCIIVKKTDRNGYDYLACYLINKSEEINLSLLKENLKLKFPTYMLPKVYMQINKFPLTINGKIDIESLPQPDFKKPLLSTEDLKSMQWEEIELLKIWQNVLETNQISIHDNFFDSGGSSLLALKLVALLQEKFHKEIKIRDVFSYPTLKEQGNLIRNYRNAKPSTNYNPASIPNPIVTLQLKGEKKPLFLIHPIGGTVFWYPKLAKLLGTSRPIYGIQDPAIDLEKPIFDSIEEMAAYYLTHIKNIQPKGPYLIGGASFGTTVALEIAHMLNKEKQTISGIIALDGWGVYPHTLRDDNYFKDSMLRQHKEQLSDFKKYGLPPPDALFEIQWQRLNLLWKYRLRTIEFPFVLFKSEEILPAFLEINAPFNHWEKFSRSPITTYLVSGNHETMFQEPHVYNLSNLINNHLLKSAIL